MQRTLLKSKIHSATITAAELNYRGSITIDRNLMDAADILPFEKVQVVNHNNGSRLETYVIEGEAGSGVICLNGPAARRGAAGDTVMIISYAILSEEEIADFVPKTVFVDETNKIVNVKEYCASPAER